MRGSLDSLTTLRQGVRRLTASAASRRLLLLIGAALFVATAVLSLLNLPPISEDPSWGTVAFVAIVLAPFTALLSGVEYRQTARLVGVEISWPTALRVSVASSAANLLPLPGSYLVRTGALRTAGADRRSAFTAPLGVGLAWVGIGGLLGGGWLLVSTPSIFAAVLFLAGIVLLGLSAMATKPTDAGAPIAAIRSIWLVEIAMTLLAGLRFFFILQAFGFDASMGQALALATSSIIATAVGIIPGGLGLRELLAGAFAPLVALPAAVGVLAAVINRVAGMVGLAIVAAFLSLAPSDAAVDPT